MAITSSRASVEYASEDDDEELSDVLVSRSKCKSSVDEDRSLTESSDDAGEDDTYRSESSDIPSDHECVPPRRLKRTLEDMRDSLHSGFEDVENTDSHAEDAQHEPQATETDRLMARIGISRRETSPEKLGATIARLRPGKRLRMEDLGTRLHMKPTPAPLPGRIQDKVDRKAAYHVARKEVEKWQDMVDLSRAKKQLIFPLEKPSGIAQGISSIVETRCPRTDIEKDFLEVLGEAESSIPKGTVDGAGKETSLVVDTSSDAVKTQERRWLREMAYREDVKNARLKRIKSKHSRLVKRRQAAKNQAKESELNPEERDPEETLAEMEQLEHDRALERMTQRHKNTSKWARAMLRYRKNDGNAREALREQSRRHHELVAKTQFDSDDQGSEMDEDISKAIDELQAASNDHGPKSRLMTMQFMERAEKKKDQALQEQLETLKKSINDGEGVDEAPLLSSGRAKLQSKTGKRRIEALQVASRLAESPVEELQHLESVSSGPATLGSEMLATGVLHVRRLHSGNSNHPSAMQMPKSSPAATPPRSSVTVASGNASAGQQKLTPDPMAGGSPTALEDSPANPWLSMMADEEPHKGSGRGTAVSALGNFGSDRGPSGLRRTAFEVEDMGVPDKAADSSGLLEPIPESRNTSSGPNHGSHSQKSKEEPGKAVAPSSSIVSSFNGVRISESQRELVQLAFGADDVLHDLETLKRREIEASIPQVQQDIPGWNTWGGHNIVLEKSARVKREEEERRKKVEEAATKRADFGLKYVAVSHRPSKKLDSLLVTRLPKGYEEAGQYEFVMRQPVGAEWTTTMGHAERITPRIVRGEGRSIQPPKPPASCSR